MSDPAAGLAVVEKRVMRARALLACAVVTGGILAGIGAAVLVVDVALLVALHVPDAALVLPVARAVLFSAGLLVATYVVVIPLKRMLPLRAFVPRLEKLVGKDTCILAACELSRQIREERAGDAAPALLAEVAVRAGRELDALQVFGLGTFRILYWLAVVVLAVSAGSLAGALAYPMELKTAAVRLFEDPRPHPRAEAPAARSHGPSRQPEARGEPPCRELTVSATPPAYLGMPVMKLAWDERARIPAGSTVEVRCEAARRERDLFLVRHEKQRVTTFPLARTGAGGAWGVLLTAGSPVLENSVFMLGRDGRGRDQPGRLEVVVLPDQKPACALYQPEKEISLRPQDSVPVLAEAVDDHGLAAVTLFYQVDGLDPAPTGIELARPGDEKRVLVQRDVPVGLFAADPGDRITLYVEVEDTNELSGPSACRTALAVVVLASPYADQRPVIEGLAGLRDAAVDLLADGLALSAAQSAEPAPVADLAARLSRYGGNLAAAAVQMSSISLFKQEDVRRVAALAAAMEDLLPAIRLAVEAQEKPTAPVQDVARELEEHALVLDGVVEKLLGEYLFYESGRLQQELATIRALAREATLDAAGMTSLMRGVKRVNRMARTAAALRDRAVPRLPSLFSRGEAVAGRDRFGDIVAITGQLLDSASSGAGDWRRGFDDLFRTVEDAARSVEGAYAQSMNRLSDSFRTSREEMDAALRKAAAMNLTLRKRLEGVIQDVQKETRDYIRRRRTLAAVQDAAQRLSSLTRHARRFNSNLYPAVDRKQVAEFRQKLAELTRLVGLLRIDESLALAGELVSLTQSMEFSLKMAIQYGKDAKLVRRSRAELEKVYEARKTASTVAGKLSAIRPHREKLASLQTDRLQELGVGVEELYLLLKTTREKVEAVQKMFPIFFSRLAPPLDRLVETMAQLKTGLAALQLDEAYRLVLFAQESIGRLQDELAAAAGEGKAGAMLAAGGAQRPLDLAGKGEAVSRDRLERYLELSAAFRDRSEWNEIATRYFSLLGQ